MIHRLCMLALLFALASVGGDMSRSAAQTAVAPTAGGGAPPPGYEDVYAHRKRLLIIADTSTGNQTAHMAISHAISVIEQLGRASGAYVTFIRTDTDLITKGEVCGTGDYARGGSRQSCGHNLDYFDAVLFYTNGETNLSRRQRQDLLDFVAQDGKGFIGVHTATATAYGWPEYGEMIGGYFDDHPWTILDAPVLVEDPSFPAMKAFPKAFTARDEIYQVRNFSRDRVRVLARLDPAKLDLKNPRVHRTDNDFAVAWARNYGRGRVFYSTFGHTEESWDDPAMQTMWVEAIKWAMGLTNADVTPRPAP